MKKTCYQIMFLVYIFSLGLISAGLIKPPVQKVYKLEITIEGIKSSKGHIKLSLQKNKKLFNTEKGIKKSKWKVAKAKKGSLKVRFKRLIPGTYAIAVFHDENDNDQLDRDLFETPEEAYGFSNNPTLKNKAPSFSEAAFKHSKNQHLNIKLTTP